MRAHQRLTIAFPIAFAVLFASTALGQKSATVTKADAEFYRGYYLQHEQNDVAEAILAYKRSIKLGAGSAIRTAVDSQMADLQEDLATADFASIMPADAIAYLEISSPADHFEQVARLMGLTGQKGGSGDDKITLPIEDGFAISSDFQISPALIRELKKIRGAALAITNVRENGLPVEGVAVIHPGDSDLIGGILETGIQLVPATDNIDGFPTFNIENQAWVVKTNRLVLVSTSKKSLAECLARIQNPQAESLALVPGFQSARANNSDAAVFGFLNPANVVKQFGHLFKGELSIVRMAMDLDHMEHVTAALMSTDAGLRAKVSIKFSEDHNSFGYGLVRTVPLSRRALKHVPAGSAAVVGMGLNPQLVLAAQAAGNRQLSALDIGREFFANIEELGLFVLPSAATANRELPNIGLVIASSDIEKSNQLWNQILSLPSMIDMDEGPTSNGVTINGVDAREYSFGKSGFPTLVIAKLGDEAMVAGTRKAVELALAAHRSGRTLVNDPNAAAFWNSNSEYTSKAAFIDVGKSLELAASLEGGNDAKEMMMIGNLVDELVVTLIVNEAPAEFEVQANVSGLPQFGTIIKTIAAKQKQVRDGRRTADRNVQTSPSDSESVSEESRR